MIKLEKIKNIIENVSQVSQSLFLNPVISIEEVDKIQSEFKISLPEEYKQFITLVGDGGIFPSKEYGCNSIQQLSKYEEFGYSFADVKIPFLLDRSWMPDWGDGIEKSEQLDEEGIERLTEERWEMINHHGHVVLVDDQTDNYMQWILIVTGPCEGEVWRKSEFGIQRLINCDFLKWLELYLTGGLEDYLIKCKIKEYPPRLDLIDRCRLFLKKKKIQMNPPIELSKVYEFEKRHNVILPSEYVSLITEIGDGSKKTPWHIKKIYSLWEHDNSMYLDQPFFIQTEEDYRQIYMEEENKHRIFERKNSIWDFLSKKGTEEKGNWLLPQYQILKGCIPLMDQGSASDAKPKTKQYILILNGRYKGQVWSINSWTISPTESTKLEGIASINALTFIEAMMLGII